MPRLIRGSLPLVVVAALLTTTAHADMVKENPMLELRLMRSNAQRARLGTNADPADGDTVWIGHVVGTHSVPWSSNPNWSGAGPFHVGRGGYRVGNNSSAAGPPAYDASMANNGYWDFDRFNPGETDTLQGWWSVPQPFQTIGAFTGNDRLTRWSFCFDYGNAGNHRGSDHGGKANYGVMSYWHVDNGTSMGATVANTNPLAPGWTPIAGSGSAWCGLRGHGDLTASDPITGNAYSATLVNNYGDNHFRQTNAANPGGSDANYPGYGSQWDQILYRDFNLTDGSSLALSFDYQTSLSNAKATDVNGNQYGYFYWDPLKLPTLNDGNFISGTDAGAANAPRDSFMVYVGVPVDDNAWRSSANPGGPGVPVYDRQHRWFSEVIDKYAPVAEVLTKTGVMAVPAGSGTITVSNAIIQPMLDARAGAGGTIRVAFRVKTDRAFDDEDYGQRGFSSGGKGAVLLDNVTVNGNATTFDTASDIDNDNATATTTAWKATGKSLASNWHWHNLEGSTPYSNLVYYDPCGAIGAPNRLCNMRGNVLSAGDHDLAERMNGGYGAWNQEKQDWSISPTINLMATGNGPGNYNDQGIDQEIADATNDIRVRFDIFPHGFDLINSGGGIRVAWASYPVTQPNGSKTWGVKKLTSFSSYTFTLGCFSFANPSGANGRLNALIQTTNANGVPDSMRVMIERLSVCFRNTSFINACGSDQTDPAGGGYIDNLAVGFVDGAAAAPLSQQPWDILQDAFPSNSNDALVGTANFDTTAAKVKSGYNNASPTGSAAPYRPVIPGDSMYVAAPGNNIRMDLVFRIYPGVGNYMTVGNPSSGLRKRPDVPGVQALAGDGSYWGSLLGDVGLFGTYKVAGTPNSLPGSYRMLDINGTLPNANTWDPNIWVSVRMDTLEKSASGTGNATAITGSYQSSVHESDLGRPHANDVTDIYGEGRRSAWNTGEYVKILPDGQFTPGTHIEYFFRRTLINNLTAFQLMPDTTLIYPQPLFGGGNFEGIRWGSMDVLPDRWKDPSRPGNPPSACLLVADYGYRRGDEVIWDNMARAIGLTLSQKVGAGHGFYSSSTGDLPASITDPAVGGVIAANRGSEGSLYDVYDVVAGESNVPAGRLGNRIALGTCTGAQTGMCATSGPTPKMLRYYYSDLIVLGADLGSTTWGPFIDQSDNDIGLFTDFITNPAGAGGVNRALRFMSMMSFDIGSGLDGQASTANFLPDFFGATLRTDDYRTDSGSTNDTPDLIPSGAPVVTNGAIYGVFSPCFTTLDAFDVNNTVNGATAAMFYENTGLGDPWVGAVYTPQDVANGRYAKTLVMGWTYGAFGGPGTLAQGLGQQGSRFTITRGGLDGMWLSLLTNMIQGCTCFGCLGSGVGDGPGQSGAPFAEFLGLHSANPVRSGTATIAFGIAKTSKVEVVLFDVGGRRIRTLANRMFEGGKEHELQWDGTDDEGHAVAAGVYFYQMRSPTFTSRKKLTVLRN